MVQLDILSGSKAGSKFIFARCPILIGRDAGADISLDAPGVWPRHVQIIRQDEGLVCKAEADAVVRVNDATVAEAVLRNGDVISIGGLKIQFALAPVRQTSLRAREWALWIGLGLLCLGQAALVSRLIR